MMNKIRESLLLVFSLSPAVGALLLYNRLPETMATHFNINNEVNGTMSKAALIILLVVLGLVPVILRVARSIDPKRANYEQFSKAFEVSRYGVAVLLAVVGWLMIAYNLGAKVDMTKVVMVIIGIFFAIMGNYLTQVRHNYMIGIRTPWTLANEDIWRKTHRMAGPLMMIGGVISIVSVFFSGSVGMIVFLTAIFVSALIPAVYSYVLYTRTRAK
jgi:uncharacterized membrane protein